MLIKFVNIKFYTTRVGWAEGARAVLPPATRAGCGETSPGAPRPPRQVRDA